MHQYRIEAFIMQSGELSLAQTRYADSPEQVRSVRAELEAMKNTDGTALYAQIRLGVGVYKLVSYSDFLALFTA